MSNQTTLSGLNPANFQRVINGKKTDLFVIKNSNGMELCVTNYGANIVSIMALDRDGNAADVILGCNTMEEYMASPCQFLGSICGRVGNRIRNARFVIDEETYQLSPNNNGRNLLHGGTNGFHAVVWDGEQIDNQTVVFTHESTDGEEGFPGNLHVAVAYTLTDDNEIEINYTAHTDAPTIVNLTNHSSFNLSGDPSSSITDHLITIPAPFYVPADEDLIPTGEILKVDGTPMDLRDETAIGANIDDPFTPLKNGGGFDSSFVLSKEYFDQLSLAATVRHPASGRIMKMFTTEPVVQFYSGNFIAQMTGKHGKQYGRRTGLCLEAQHFVNSCNLSHFPTTLLREDDVYTQTTIYQFLTDK